MPFANEEVPDVMEIEWQGPNTKYRNVTSARFAKALNESRYPRYDVIASLMQSHYLEFAEA